jgi:hypothetical protein
LTVGDRRRIIANAWQLPHHGWIFVDSQQSKDSSRMDEVIRDAERELKRVVQFVNDKVVPEVRGASTTALRSAAEQLQKLADLLEQNKKAS